MKTRAAKRPWAAVFAACLALALTAPVAAAPAFAEEAADAETPAAAAASAEGTSAEVDPMADRTIVDDLGREVTIPGVGALERVYYTSPIGQIFTFTLAPELCAGTTMDFTEQELMYLPEGTADLPNLGTLAAGGELNPEAILAADIQLILMVGSPAPTESDGSFADDLQNQTGIPVVVLDGSFENTPECYERLGEILGKEDEAAVLAEYCQTVTDEVAAAVETIPEDERVTLYYAEGPDGLQTDPAGSSHTLVFELAGAINVAQVETEAGAGRATVSLEQVLDWNPEVIISWDAERFEGGADEIIRTDPNWSTIQAVQDGKVYTMVQTPFSWLDRPPAVNRFIGLQWLTNLLYPEAYDIDIVATVQEFYDLFYHCDISEEEVIDLLGNSYQGDAEADAETEEAADAEEATGADAEAEAEAETEEAAA